MYNLTLEQTTSNYEYIDTLMNTTMIIIITISIIVVSSIFPIYYVL